MDGKEEKAQWNTRTQKGIIGRRKQRKQRKVKKDKKEGILKRNKKPKDKTNEGG